MVDSSGCRSIECAPVILPDQELVFRNFTGNPVCGSVVRPLLFRDLSSFTGNPVWVFSNPTPNRSSTADHIPDRYATGRRLVGIVRVVHRKHGVSARRPSLSPIRDEYPLSSSPIAIRDTLEIRCLRAEFFRWSRSSHRSPETWCVRRRFPHNRSPTRDIRGIPSIGFHRKPGVAPSHPVGPSLVGPPGDESGDRDRSSEQEWAMENRSRVASGRPSRSRLLPTQ
ncbi:hypothetical protein SAMN05216285_0321 [Natrinema salifodinae]|uniref:Uncharacterized protein n=1 Tax=Natrinema salifodinae TaxID=1202768 RepID=A0A1I0M3A8_9EURY|nr:hypothetical protein SAMN05216285_0321 [Natrinema salifodinae]